MKIPLFQDAIIIDGLSLDKAAKVLEACNKTKAANHLQFKLARDGDKWTVTSQSRQLTVKFMEHPEDFIIEVDL